MKIIVKKNVPAKDSMREDLKMLSEFEGGQGEPTLRIYSWMNPSITLGYSQDPTAEIDEINCAKLGIDVAKRPTGGGILFHAKEDIAFGIVIPLEEGKLAQFDALDKTALAIARALASIGITAEISPDKKEGERRYCCSYPSRSEITVGGKKLVGLAQKKGRRAVLQQGAIFIGDTAYMLAGLKIHFPESELKSKTTNLSEVFERIPDLDEIASIFIKELGSVG